MQALASELPALLYLQLPPSTLYIVYNIYTTAVVSSNRQSYTDA